MYFGIFIFTFIISYFIFNKNIKSDKRENITVYLTNNVNFKNLLFETGRSYKIEDEFNIIAYKDHDYYIKNKIPFINLVYMQKWQHIGYDGNNIYIKFIFNHFEDEELTLTETDKEYLSIYNLIEKV